MLFFSKAPGHIWTTLEMKRSQGEVDAKSDEPETKKMPPAKKPKRLYEPPTADELNELKETENLFKSNLFRLQMNELLQETSLTEHERKSYEIQLHNVKSALEDIQSKEDDIDLSLVSSIGTGAVFEDDSDEIYVPLCFKTCRNKGTFTLCPPTRVQVVGSFLLKTQAKFDADVDIAVEIPKECFGGRDHLNHLYTVKRAVYLAYVASHLKRKRDLFTDIKYVLLDSNPLRPCLQLKSGDCLLRIHPVIPEGVLKLVKLWPSKNNVRVEKFFKNSKKRDDAAIIATPSYNTSLLLDLSYERNLRILYESCSACLAMRDAILLVRVWLHQRRLSKGPGGFNGFIASMLIAYLFEKEQVNAMMSSYQIFRVVLQFLVDSDLSTQGISFVSYDDSKASHFPALDEFHQHFDVVFVDSSGLLNLCASMKKDNYLNIRHEAKLALSFLGDIAIDGFDALFLTPVNFTTKFDQYFYVPLAELKTLSRKIHMRDFILAEAGNWIAAWIDRILPLLLQGLGKRIRQMAHELHVQEEWDVSEASPDFKKGYLSFGLLLDSDHAFSILDKGPPADDAQAVQFRNFWGDKSEMRRFQDGSILEAVLWPCENQADRRTICRRIVTYLIEKYGKLDGSSVLYVGDQLDPFVKTQTHGTGEEEIVAVFTAFESLTRDLRKLTDLPLVIQSLQGTSAVFRGTQVMPCGTARPVGKQLSADGHGSRILAPSDSCSPWCPSYKVVCHLEGSGKWPDDVDAMQRIKAAFHLKIADLTSEKCHLVAIPRQTSVSIVKDGFVFCLSVANDKEILLLRSSASLEKEESATGADNLEMENVNRPLLTSTLRGVHMRFSAFALTARLAKRWISSQLLSFHISDECVELLVAHLFLSPAPYAVPGSGINGFQRFLYLLCHHNWNSTPLLVNLNDEFKKEDFDEIPSHFSSKRDELPAVFIATPRDKDRSIWTRNGPNPVIVYRLVLLAREALKAFIVDDVSAGSFSLKQIFRPSLDDFDVIIRLKPSHLPRLLQAKGHHKQKPQKSRPIKSDTLPVFDFNPAVEYLTDLEDAYGDVAMFFHDLYGGALIAVVWKPTAIEPQAFKIGSVVSLMPQAKGKKEKLKAITPGKTKMIINKKAIIEDFKRLGEDLVDSIEIQKS